MHQHFRIRVIRLEYMAGGFEFGSQFSVIVNTPIKHHRHHRFVRLNLTRNDRRITRLVGQVWAEAVAVVDHGLGAALVVDDRESSVDERDIDDGAVVASGSIAEAALAVGASVFDGFVENVEPRFRDRFERRWGSTVGWIVNLDDACDAAHG